MDEGLLAISIQIQANSFSNLLSPLVLSHQTLSMKGTVKAYFLHQAHQAQHDYVLYQAHQSQQAYFHHENHQKAYVHQGFQQQAYVHHQDQQKAYVTHQDQQHQKVHAYRED